MFISEKFLEEIMPGGVYAGVRGAASNAISQYIKQGGFTKNNNLGLR